MTIESDIAALSQVKMFSSLSEEQLRLLAFSCETVKLNPNDVLFQEGDVAGAGFVVTLGMVQLVNIDGKNVSLIESAETGAVINELAFISETLRPATAIAAEKSEVIKIRRSLFHRFIGQYPDIAIHLEKSLSDQLAETIVKLKKAHKVLTR